MRRPVLLATLVLSGCTDTGLYAVGTGGPSGPDRVELKGQACVPLAAGEAFPVKVVFAVEGGTGVDTQIVENVVTSLNKVATQFATPYISFAVVGYHAIATGFQGSFSKDISQAIVRYATFQEAGPVSARAPLKLAQSIISGDMQTGCRGTVARTRYLVVQVILSADTSCANPIFNPGIAARCNAFLPTNPAECSACELARVTEEVRALADRYGAGEVTIQPVYVRTSPDIVTRYQAAAIARAGGTELIETTPDALERALASLNYASLQRALILKQLVAMNRNALSRNGQVLVDSDGDGVSDDDELAAGTEPSVVDSDGDRLSDGVEMRMGLKPQYTVTGANINIVTGCNTETDTDGDRLNDCEERVLGTDACIADTDGDGMTDLVEHLGGTNPLIPEDLQDGERDGLANMGELQSHTDPISADIEFQQERGYGYTIKLAEPTPDGRACYDIDIYNVTVVETLSRPSPDSSGLTIPQGTNDIYVYMQVGRENDPRGTGIGALFVAPVIFTPKLTPKTPRRPKGVVAFTPEDFNTGY